jgi:uncharacterized membrane protein/Mg-chelatase subunit ChlD
MSISFLYPYALWLLLLIPLTIGLALVGPQRPTRFRFWSGLVLRVLLLVMIVMALAGIQVRLPSNLLTVVFVLDISDSLLPDQQAQGEAFIQEAILGMEKGSQSAIVIFGKDALVERLASAESRLAPFSSIPVTVGTDIESALQLGLALFPDEGARRLVLLSDGRENIGQAIEQAEFAAAHGVELSYVPLGGPQGEAEVLISALESPAVVRQGQDYEVRVLVESSVVNNATLRVFGDGVLIYTHDVILQAGTNRFLVPVKAGETGFRRFSARILPDVDTRLQNNEAGTFTVVFGPPSVLVVEGQPGEAENLQRALEAAEMQVTRIAPEALPASLPELAAFESVVLVNVSAEALPPGVMEVLQVYVRDLGRGLLMVGGEETFGAGGYLRTPLEATLPVDMDVRTTEQTPNTAVVLAVDKSGSMGRCHCDDPDLNQTYDRLEVGQPKVDIAKAAILSASSALGREDYLGVVAFDAAPKWSIDVQKLLDAVSVEQSIGAITADGQTNLEAGVREAYSSLENVEARVKHVILMTDGWVRGGDVIALAREMREKGITLSVVAAGEGSAEFLELLALSGGGRYYPAEDIFKVPEFFLKETVKTVGRYINETPFYPLPDEGGHPILRGLDAATLPALLGYNGTTPKTTARVPLSTPAGDPLLATWQYGLGKAAVWTSDLKGQWAVDWVGWEGFSRFTSQLVAWTLPTPQVEGVEATASFHEGEAQLQVNAIDQADQPRNFLEVEAALIAPDLDSTPVTLDQVGPGRYEASVPLNQTGAYLAQVTVSEGGQVIGQQTIGLAVPYSAEYKTSGTDIALLSRLAELTGGGQLNGPLDAFLFNLPSAARAREIWAPLLLIVALLFPLDIAIRRVMLGGQDFRNAGSWIRSRLPFFKRAEGTGEREPVLGQLFSARERARQRQTRQREDQVKPMPASKRTHTPQPTEPAKDDGVAKGEDLPTPTEQAEDTLARLRSAKQRSRKNRDGS